MRYYKTATRRAWKRPAMKGVRPNPRTGILELRKTTPLDLQRERDKLLRLGLPFAKVLHRSLGVRNTADAAVPYAEKLLEIEAIWDNWRSVLKGGPVSLTQGDAIELAAIGAASRYEALKDNPLDAPPRPTIPPPPSPSLPQSVLLELASVSVEEREEARQEWLRIGNLLAHGSRLDHLKAIKEIRESKGWLGRFPILKAHLHAAAESVRGEETTNDLKRAGILATDIESRLALNLEGMAAESRLQDSLEQRALGDLGRPQWVADAQAAESHRAKRKGNAKTLASGSRNALTFESIIDEEERLAGLRLQGHTKSMSTLRKYRTECQNFADHRGSTDVLTVTLKEAEAWRDSLLAEAAQGKRNRKAVRVMTGIPRAVLSWAIVQNKEEIARDSATPPIFEGGNPLQALSLPAVEHSDPTGKAFTEEQAIKLLKASRLEERPEFRWLSWLMAYSGMRLMEAAQLEKQDVRQYKGHWYCVVRYRMGATLDKDRTQKGKKTRMVPLHDAVIAEGFVEWWRSRPDGPLFSRKSIDQRYREWVHEVFPKGLDGRAPAHAWRHLFEEMIVGWESERSQDYITGRGIKGSAGSYGQGEAIIPGLSKLVNSIPTFLPIA